MLQEEIVVYIALILSCAMVGCFHVQLERWKETREFVKLDSLAIGPCVKREIVFLADRLLFDYSVQFVNYYFPNVEEDEFFYVALVTAIISANVVLSSTAEDDKFVLLFPVFIILFGLGITNVMPIQFKFEIFAYFSLLQLTSAYYSLLEPTLAYSPNRVRGSYVSPESHFRLEPVKVSPT